MIRCSISQMRQLGPFRAVIPSEKPLAEKLTPPQLTVLMVMLLSSSPPHHAHYPCKYNSCTFIKFLHLPHPPLPITLIVWGKFASLTIISQWLLKHHNYHNHPLFRNTFRADWYCCIPFLSGTSIHCSTYHS